MKKKKNLNLTETVYFMQLAFTNAQIPEIITVLEPAGYTEEQLNGLLKQTDTLNELISLQHNAYSKKYAITLKIKEKRNKIDLLYKRHITFARLVFKGNIDAYATLELSGRRKLAYADWFLQVSNFYTQILQDDALLQPLEELKITRNELETAQKLLKEIALMKEEQKKATGDAQEATKRRDKALEPLKEEYKQLITYARVLLEDVGKEQLLECMGIVVK